MLSVKSEATMTGGALCGFLIAFKLLNVRNLTVFELSIALEL